MRLALGTGGSAHFLRDGKLRGGGVSEKYLIKDRDVTVKKISMKHFCIIKKRLHIWTSVLDGIEPV